MITSKYENLYASVRQAKCDIAHVDEVVEFLLHSTGPVLPKEIGVYLFGEDYLKPTENSYPYHYNYCKASQRSTIAQIMRHLHAAGLVKRVYLDGDPIEVEHEKWILDTTPYNVPRMIQVHDDEGNTYTIENPKWNWVAARMAQESGHYETVKETIIPKIKAWAWVEN